MPAETTRGLVLRTVDFSETSKVVTLFTRDFGKLGALAKGARRLKSGFEVALDLLSVCDIGVIRKASAELDLLTEAVLVRRFDGFRKDLLAYYAGCFVAEIVDALTAAHDPHAGLFELAVETLAQLEQGAPGTRGLAICRFGLILLREIGLAPNFEHCVRCEATAELSVRTPISLPLGGLLCRSCSAGQKNLQYAQGATVQTARRLSQDSWEQSQRLAPSRQAMEETWRLVLGLLEQAMGRKTKTGMLVRLDR